MEIYCKTPEEFANAVEKAKADGYGVKESEAGPGGKITGNSVFCTLEIPHRYGKCGYCGELIDWHGIYGHGRVCEKCGKVINLDLIKGDLVSFRFIDDRESLVGDVITLRVAKIDVEKNLIYFYKKVPKHQYRSWTKMTRDKILKKLEQFKDKYTVEKLKEQSSQEFICMIYNIKSIMIENSPINTYETRNSKGSFPHGFRKCSLVKVWEGKEYSEYSFGENGFPVPESYTIYRDWMIEKNISLICHRCGLSSRPEYYSGRGVNEGDLNSKHLIKIHKMLKEFHGEDAAKEFEKMLRGIEELSATSFLKHLQRFERNGLKHVPIDNKEEKKEANNDISFTDEIGAFATVMSKLMSPSIRGHMYMFDGLMAVDGVKISDAIEQFDSIAKDYGSRMILSGFFNGKEA